MTLSDVGGELVQSLYLIHTSVSCQPARYTYIVPAHSKPSYTMTSTSIVRLTNIATEYSYENLEFLKEALPSVSTTATPCMYHHVNPFASNCHDYPPHEFVLHCPNELLPEIFHAIQSAINGQDAPTSIYQQNLIGLSPFNVRALSTWIMQFNINCALPSVCESTISSAAISMKSVKLQCQGGQHAHPPYTHEILNASVSFKHVTYATYTNKFKTPSIGTTTTSPVYYYYEFHELSSIRLPMIIAFTIMATACVLRLLVARIQTTEVPRCFNCTTKHRNRRHTALRADFLRHEARQVVRNVPYQAFHRTVPDTSAFTASDVWLQDFMPRPHNVWLHDFTPIPHDDLKKPAAG